MAEIASHRPPLLESGVLAYRLDRRGEPRVLVLTTAKTGRWGIPKGRVEPQFGFAENAAREAFEEAGVLGEVAPVASGCYRTMKRVHAVETMIEVWVYLMKVTEVLKEFPEKGRREVKWVSADEAAELLREPLLAKLCHDLPERTKSVA
ncbi:NTP pyrophosphohydrolase [Aliidongia dinghuensis]|uniref:NTP pyrophosphohydrolase n=1 Tax=Aliidongia dinghuensis TaxID=1867774 RepID=A0A8J3E5T2_9PROT|nr:NUDIX hydrolase [Aliidongia dinghuensis]GGF38370.1 NTP pyrophosphohydrolase [Aliidongia dinghuensis]